MSDIELVKQDLTYLSWSRIRHSSGTAGSFLKATDSSGKKKIYYKMSDYNSAQGITGHECVNELIVDRLLTLLGAEHLHYRLIHADIAVDGKVIDGFICASEDFKKPGEEKLALDAYYEMEKKDGETPFDFCVRMGWKDYICEMLAVDFLILNRDRHGANIEVLRSKKNASVRLAPLFDHGLSLLCRCQTKESISRFDITEDKRVQSFVGGASALNNLKLIPKDSLPHFRPLKPSDRQTLLDGLSGVVSEELLDKIWELIWFRWCIYEDFCGNG